MSLPREDKMYNSLNEMKEEIVVLLGGRVAESLIFGDITTGASNDIERATDIARSMVTRYGMSQKLGPIAFGQSNDEIFIGRDMGHVKNYSEKVASEIDDEIYDIVKEGYDRVTQILTEHMDKLHEVAQVLLVKEKISGDEFDAIMKGTYVPEPEETESEKKTETVSIEKTESEEKPVRKVKRVSADKDGDPERPVRKVKKTRPVNADATQAKPKKKPVEKKPVESDEEE